MRNRFKITAHKLFTLSALGLLTSVFVNAEQPKINTTTSSKTSSPITKAVKKNEEPKFLAEAMCIHLEFLADVSISATDITPTFKNGKIYLKGNVNNKEVSEKALSIAEKITTCKVVNDIKHWPFPSIKPTKVTLETLQNNTSKLVGSELLSNFPKIAVAASIEGTILVTGPVVTLEDKLEISQKIRKVSGCVRVVNKMIVQPMRIANETITMVTKDGTKYLSEKEQAALLATITTFKSNQRLANQIENPSIKPTNSADPFATSKNQIISTQAVSSTTKEKEQNGINQKKPKNLPESLVPVKPETKPLPVPTKTVDVLAVPKLPDSWQTPEPNDKKPIISKTTKAPAVPIDAKAAENTSGKESVFPSFPAVIKKTEKPEPVAKEISQPKELPFTKQTTTPLKTEAKTVVAPNPLDKSVKETMTAKIISPKAPSINNEVIKAKINTEIKSVARVFAPAHDPIGSAPVRADMKGFPKVRKEVAEVTNIKPVQEEKIPARYAKNSDNDPNYNRPYLALKTTPKPVSPEKTMTTSNSIDIAKNPAIKTPTVLTKPLTKKDELRKPELPSTTVAVEKQKQVPAKTASMIKVDSNPAVTTGSISFDFDEVEKQEESKVNPNTSLLSLKKQVDQVCGKKAKSVQIIEKPNGSKIILIELTDHSKQEELAAKIFVIPEVAQSNASVEFILK